MGAETSEACRESARLDWKEDNVLLSPSLAKSVMLAVRGSRQGSALPALMLRDRVSEYILAR